MLSLPSFPRNVDDAERVASAVGGALLALYGLSRRSPGGIALAGLGGVLAYRGTTGHCPAFAALGMSTADGATPAPVQVVEAVTVTTAWSTGSWASCPAPFACPRRPSTC